MTAASMPAKMDTRAAGGGPGGGGGCSDGGVNDEDGSSAMEAAETPSGGGGGGFQPGGGSPRRLLAGTRVAEGQMAGATDFLWWLVHEEALYGRQVSHCQWARGAVLAVA